MQLWLKVCEPFRIVSDFYTSPKTRQKKNPILQLREMCWLPTWTACIRFISTGSKSGLCHSKTFHFLCFNHSLLRELAAWSTWHLPCQSLTLPVEWIKLRQCNRTLFNVRVKRKNLMEKSISLLHVWRPTSVNQYLSFVKVPCLCTGPSWPGKSNLRPSYYNRSMIWCLRKTTEPSGKTT